MGSSYKTPALVIRSYDFGEADRVIVLLTPEGLIRGVAKGVRKSKSRFGSRLEPFVLLSAQLYPGRNLDTITGADSVEYFGSGIIDNYERYTAACAVLEAAERLEADIFDLVLWALREIQMSDTPTIVLDSFLLQAMEPAGWAPQLFDCANCGAPGPHAAFHPEAGGALCVNCQFTGAEHCEPEVLHFMWLLSKGHLSFSENWVTAHRLVTGHLQWHVERRLSSLNFVDKGWTD